MNELTLTRRLGALEPPGIDGARERAIQRLPSLVAASRESAKTRDIGRFSQTRGPGRRQLAYLALVACLTLVSCGLLTQPGQAVTSWVGDRLGFGQPGQHPSLRQLRHAWTRGTAAEGQPAYVLAVGPALGGGRYEYITYWPQETKGHRHGGRWTLGEPCFELDLPQQRASYGGGCGVLPEGPDIGMAGFAGSSSGEELLALYGQVGMQVGSLEARLDGEPPRPLELKPIPAELVDRFHLSKRFQFFVGFRRGKLEGGTAVIVARDTSGEVLARRRVELPNIVAAMRSR